MAINPLQRPVNFDVPNFPASAVRPDPSVWSNIASLGQAIGDYRLRQQIGELVASATDDQGNVDQQKALAALGKAGLLSPEALSVAGYRQQALAQHAAQQAETERANRENERLRAIEANRPQYSIQAPDPVFGGGSILEAPRVPGQPPRVYPWPTVPGAPAPAPTPGPQSGLEPGAFGPGPMARAPSPFNPEEGPPYQIAGEPVAAPRPAPAAQPAPPEPTARNENYLQGLPTDYARTLIKGVADYSIDPNSLGEYKARIIAAAKMYRPDYKESEYQKRQTPPSGEIAARIGLGKAFLDRGPAIEARIQANELNSLEGRAMALVGQGGPGELRRAIDEGAEALLRGLTGAGMSQNEANNYARRYQFNLIDTKETQLRKLGELQNALRYVGTAVGEGRGGENFMKGYESKFGKPVTGSSPAPGARGPEVGTVSKGYRFRGGDPARQENWEAVR